MVVETKGMKHNMLLQPAALDEQKGLPFSYRGSFILLPQFPPFFDNHVRLRSSRLKTQDNHFLIDQGVVISKFGDEIQYSLPELCSMRDIWF